MVRVKDRDKARLDVGGRVRIRVRVRVKLRVRIEVRVGNRDD
jgi:hypothetical protein